MNEATSSALTFLLFAGISFVLLRYILNTLARMNKAAWAGPILILLGALAGRYFFSLGMHQYFIWYLVIFGLVIMSWHAKSHTNQKKLQQISGDGAAPDPEVIQAFTMTRRLLSFGLVSYLAAFSAAYYYLYTRP
jgi:hypothetical protein